MPVARAGVDRAVLTGSEVKLYGGASTVGQGSSLVYIWSIKNLPVSSNASLSSTTDCCPTFTPDLDGRYVFTLVVDDGEDVSQPDSVTMTAGPSLPPPDTMSLDIDGSGLTAYTETYVTISNSRTGYDPMMDAAYYTNYNSTMISLSRTNLNGWWMEQLDLMFPGNTPGTYTLTGSSWAYAVYNSYEPDSGDHTSVSIVVDQCDAVGGRIRGSFDATLCLMETDCSDPVNLKTFVGSFDVIRDDDR